MASNPASETSPLLGASGDTTPASGSNGTVETPDVSKTRKPHDAQADGEQQTSPANEQPKPYGGMPEVRKRLHLIFPAMAVGVILVMADGSIVVSSYGRIGTDLNALNLTSWIASAYFLTLTAFQPLYGRLSDIFSRKSCLLFAYTVFGLGSLACGLSPNIETLIAARALAGIGGGGIPAICSIIMSDIIPLRERGTWQGYMNIIAAIGSGAGAPLGGLLADTIGWRWAFLAQAPLCAVASIVVAIWLKLPAPADGHWKEKLGRIDFGGALTLICAMSALMVALDRGSNVSWADRLTQGALVLSVPLFALFIFVEMRLAKAPFAPGHVVFGAGLFACYACYLFTTVTYVGTSFYVPLYWQAVTDISAGQAGLQLIPQLVFATAGSLLGGIYMKKRGIYKTLTILACAVFVLGMAITLVSAGAIRPFNNTISTIGMIAGSCILCFAAGMTSTTLLISLIANVDPADQAVATACSYLFRSLGSAIGVSLSATVSNVVLRDSLHDQLGNGKQATEIADHVRQSLDYLRQLKPDVKSVVVECFAHSIRCAFALQTGVACLTVVSAIWIREKRLNK